jgi:hypothetical protein
MESCDLSPDLFAGCEKMREDITSGELAFELKTFINSASGYFVGRYVGTMAKEISSCAFVTSRGSAL